MISRAHCDQVINTGGQGSDIICPSMKTEDEKLQNMPNIYKLATGFEAHTLHCSAKPCCPIKCH